VAVELKKTTFKDPEVNRLRADVDDVVRQLDSADAPNVVVKQLTTSSTLSGDEDYVLVDMTGATKDVYLLLPQPGAVSRAITVKLTKGNGKSLFVKGSDAGTVKINNGTEPVKVTDSVKVIATPTQFYTV